MSAPDTHPNTHANTHANILSNARQFQQLDLNLLKVFEALYIEQNMTTVAQTLHITPSAVSHAIKRLRSALHTSNVSRQTSGWVADNSKADLLFVRKGQKMQPTVLCQRIAPKLIANLQQMRTILQQGGQFDPLTTEQTFTIAIPSALESLFMPALYQQLAPKLPYAQFACINLQREHIVRQLATREVDMAIDVARAIESPIMHKKLSSDPLVVLCRPDRERRADRESRQSLSLSAYLAAKHIVVSHRPIGTVLEDFALLQQGYNRQVSLRCQNYQTARDIVAQSELLLTLPSVLAKNLVVSDSGNTLECHPLPIEIAEIETHIYWHDTTEEDEAMRWLREQIQRWF